MRNRRVFGMMNLLSLGSLMVAVSIAGAEEGAEAPVICAVPNASAAATEGAACCAVPETTQTAAAVEPLDLPWTGAALGNKVDPISGEDTTDEIFLPYADETAGVYARVYFASKQSLEQAKKEDLKALYTRAYLTLGDGSALPYGSTRLVVNNSMCPVSGVGATAAGLRNPLLEFDAAAAKNCTAGSCSVGDGYKANYNAISMNVCCPSCAKKFGNAPANHIRNIWKDVDAALSVEPSSTT